MRKDLKKFLFLGMHQSLENFFGKAQDLGLVHFIDTGHLKAKEMPSDIQTVSAAIKIVRGLPTMEQEELANWGEVEALAQKIVHLHDHIERLNEERRVTRLEIARIEVFGSFSHEDIRYIEEKANRKVQFFFAKKGIAEELNLPDEVLYVASAHGLDYFMAIHKEPKQYDRMVEMKIEHELPALHKRYDEIEAEIHESEQKLKTYEKYNQFLHKVLVHKYNSYNLKIAQNYSRPEMEGALFAVEGWVPENKRKALLDLVKELNVTVEEIAIEEEDVIPTYLENEGVNRIGEDLVNIYDTPSHKDKDPSFWVLLSFALFFAMIIGDGGYGLLFLGGALYMRYKMPKMRQATERFWKLALILCVSCVGWGLLSNSFFGLQFAPDSVMRKVSVVNWLVEKKAEHHFTEKDAVYSEWVGRYPELESASSGSELLQGAKREVNGKVSYEMVDKLQDGIMMELALLVGILHVSFSFLRYLDRNWAGVGWVIAIFGCYFYFPVFLQGVTMLHYVFGVSRDSIGQEGLRMIYGGLGLALGLAVVQHKFLGLLEISNLIQVFADVLSYLRLYALALAGSIISGIVNEMAASMLFVGAGLLLVLGHGLNILLSVIGGVIHGLRLNFIEWYHYSFEGGGKKFDPLRKIELE